MQMKERVRRDWHAEPEYKFRAAVSARGDGLGLVDAAGPIQRIALLKVHPWKSSHDKGGDFVNR